MPPTFPCEKKSKTSPRLLLISIADDGHYGLLEISERVALWGDRLPFENQKSGGLLVQVEAPHPKIIKAVF